MNEFNNMTPRQLADECRKLSDQLLICNDMRIDEVDNQRKQVDDLAMLVKRLVQALYSTSKNKALQTQAMNYLSRHNLEGSPLRQDHKITSTMLDVDADEAMVVMATEAMTAKLAKKRNDGRGGWHGSDCTTDRLRSMLEAHVHKGDMVDVLNIAGMIYAREQSELL